MFRRLALAALAVFLLATLLALPMTRRLLWSWESNPVLRGRVVAQRNGCFNCHLGASSVEIPNPGSRWGSVPRFAAGNAMMYVEGREEIEEFIRFGAPRSWTNDATVRDRLATQLLRMPAYEDLLSDSEIRDLVAYVEAIEHVAMAGAQPGDAAAGGRELAKRHGCLACHGVEGSGGLPNPGSLGGFIPGFVGGNFPDLVASEAEFREWVLDGESSRLAANPLVQFFWRRQQIAMPAYREELSPEEVESLWQWVAQLRDR